MKLEYHFDLASPNCYYSHKVIPEIERCAGETFDYFPILLGGVFKSTNNRSPMEQFAGVKKAKALRRAFAIGCAWDTSTTGTELSRWRMDTA